MPKKSDSVSNIIKTALDLAAERGWRDLTLAEISAGSGVALPELYRHFPSKSAILDGFARSVDEAMLADGPADPADTARDRLFDLLMRRFDALQVHRDGLNAIARELRRDPIGALSHLPQLERSMRWTLEAAGLDAGGLLGLARVRVLGLLYLSVLRVWQKDDTSDMARTMKALDGRLGQLEQLANTVERGGRRRRGPPTGEPAGGPTGEPAGDAPPEAESEAG
jgi:AcrR family transcriptional regulator